MKGLKNIEVEIRSFISKEKYEKLLKFFKKKGELIKEDSQESFYFDCDQDLRIQKNDFYSKVWMKKGNLHDKYREEIEIKFDKKDFGELEKLFLSLGFNVDIKWFRKRYEFKWEDVTVCLDYTKGYGYIIELEKMSSVENQKEKFEKLKQKLESLNIKITPKKEFKERFDNYKKNWIELTKTDS